MSENWPNEAIVAALCLAAVIGLILVAARAARSLPALRLQTQPPGALVLRGTLSLDRTHRVHLVEADGRQALILTGGTSPTLVTLQGQP